MSKIYLVISGCGEWAEDYEETILKGFKDIKKAERYLAECEEMEQTFRDAAERCRNCGGLDRTCPLYQIPFSVEEECGAYEPWHDNKYFRIEEVEFDGEKDENTEKFNKV